MRGITKAFPGVKALDNVDFNLSSGEIHALMGENGAGKSTLIQVLTGVYQLESGEITLDGKKIAASSPLDAQKLGISAVFQEINLIPYLSVAENLFLGREPRRGFTIDWKTIRSRSVNLLQEFGIDIDVSLPLNNYSVAIQQMIAIARAVNIDAKILVLDEPTSSLDSREVEQLFSVMNDLKARGLGIVFITHFLGQVYRISDRITILRNGRLVGTFDKENLPRLQLVSKMLGKNPEELPTIEHCRATQEGETDRKPFMKVSDLGRKGMLESNGFDIYSGEILGLAGLLGSGRTETARLLFGCESKDQGRIEIDGQIRHIDSPKRAIDQGLGFCPENRKSDGLVSDLSVRENIILALQAKRGWARKYSLAGQKKIADSFVKMLNIATTDLEKEAGTLSGGNQQKVILTRWLAMQPRLLILDEPTRGIDVGAKVEIQKIMTNLCQDGMAILFISSELEEVVRDSHRVVIMRDRRKIGQLQGDEVELSAIMSRIAE